MTGPILFLFFPASFAHAILRHRLFDVSVVVRRGIQYALARGMVIAALPAAIALFLADVGIHAGDIGVVAIGNFVAHTSRSWLYAVVGVVALVRSGGEPHGSIRSTADSSANGSNAAADSARDRGGGPSGRVDRQVAGRVITRIDAALHPEFVAVLVRVPNDTAYHALASRRPA